MIAESELKRKEIPAFFIFFQEILHFTIFSRFNSMSLNPHHQVQPAPLNIFFCFFNMLFKTSIGFSKQSYFWNIFYFFFISGFLLLVPTA
jgi:hypothetical protein